MIHKIFTERAPAPIGPYSQAIIVDGKFIYTAGQLPINPQTGKIVEGDIKEQTRQVLENLDAVLIAGGASLSSVVKTMVFLKDMNDFPAMNDVYTEYFKKIAPARSTVEVTRLPQDVRIEIEAIAVIERSVV